MKNVFVKSGVAIAVLLTAQIASQSVRAEPAELRVSKQYGLAFLPLMVMEAQNFYDARAKQAGIPTKINWLTLGGPAASNEALLSGNADIIANGPPAFLIMWDRTRGSSREVKGIAPLVSQNMYLNTRDPNVRSIKDFSEKHKIAMSSAKTSIAAIILQMAAAKEWGQDQYNRLDHLTVSLPHPDGVNALASGSTEINAHFTAPPYQSIELKSPNVRTVLTSADVMGGLSTAAVMFSTEKFYKENPKAIKAFVEALRDAQKFIYDNPGAAADIYLQRAREGGLDKPEVMKLLADPSIRYTPEPQQIMTYAKFLNKVGTLKAAPSAWSDVFIDLAKDQNGS